MTAAERIAQSLAEQLGGLDATAMAARAPFRSAVDDALAVLDEASIVRLVVEAGSLVGARNPHAVVVSRLRQIPTLHTERVRAADDRAEAARWATVDRAARRGENLRALVDAGTIFADEAEGVLASEFAADTLREIAAAALTGGQR